jgi:hypothetical protein
MGIISRYGRVLTVIALVLAVVPVFAAPASAQDYTGWDFDFDIRPSTIELGQYVDISVHVYYWGNDSNRQPFTANAIGRTVTITSPFFNTIEVTDNNGFLNNTDHPDELGNFTYTATVIFQSETKTKSLTLTVNPVGAATPAPIDNVTGDIAGDEINLSNLDKPLLGDSQGPNQTGISTPAPSVIAPVTATPAATPATTPAPTKSPSGFLTLLGTVTILALAGFAVGKKQ